MGFSSVPISEINFTLGRGVGEPRGPSRLFDGVHVLVAGKRVFVMGEASLVRYQVHDSRLEGFDEGDDSIL